MKKSNSIKVKLNNGKVIYPLPDSYELTTDKKGNLKVLQTVKNEHGDDKKYYICSAIGVAARIRKIDEEDAYSIRIHIEAMDGCCRKIDIDRAELVSTGREVMKKLLSAGLSDINGNESAVINMLKSARPDKEILSVSKTGWHFIEDESAPIFIAPSGEAIGCTKTWVEFNKSSSRKKWKSGSLEEWEALIELVASIENTPHWMFGVMAGFAGVILSLCGYDGCGVNLSGQSSIGKSTSMRLAASVWGATKGDNSLMKAWRTTDNALEALSKDANGTLLALDELSHADGRVVAKAVFSLAGGSGKARMTKAIELDKCLQWNTFYLSNGEHSLKETIEADKGKWRTGISVRFPDVDVSDVNASVDKAVLDEIDNGLRKHYGHAGVAFVKALMQQDLHINHEQLREMVFEAANNLSANAEGAKKRAAQPFALIAVAGHLAQNFGLIPASANVDSVIQWAWDSYLSSSDSDVLDPNESIISNLREWIMSNKDRSIKSVACAYPNSVEADGWYDDECVYIRTARISHACGKTFKPQMIGKILSDLGILHRRTDKNKATYVYIKGIGNIADEDGKKVRFYCLSKDALGLNELPFADDYVTTPEPKSKR